MIAQLLRMKKEVAEPVAEQIIGNQQTMNLLNTIGEDANVFVISHKGDQLLDKFKSVIKFQKYQNFSRIS
jgi:hypothetical protein